MSFYPPGWDYNRLLNCSRDEMLTLTDEQHSTLLNGLKEAGLYQGWVDELTRRDEETRAAEKAAAEANKTEEEKLADREVWAPYIGTLKSVFKFQDDWSEWGFVIFRTTPYGKPEHEAQWAEFRRRWDRIIEDDYEAQHGFHPKSDKAIELLRFRWVEDPSLEGASPAEVARHYDEIWAGLPRGMLNSTCLMVTPDALESVLDSPLPSSARREDRKKLPFVVAVSRGAYNLPFKPAPGEEEEDVFGQDFKGYFHVAVESLLGEFYPIVALDITDLPKLTVRMRHDKDIWCHSWRGGVRFFEEQAEP